VASACSSGDDASGDTTTTAAATVTTAAPDAPTTTAAPTEPVEPPTPENRLAGLKVVDDLTFTAELNVADPEFALWMYYTAYLPLPSVAYENTLGYNNAPIGNGPYMFPEGGAWEHDTAINLVANPDYAGDAPANDGVSFVISADLGTDYLEALDGNLDVLTNIDPDRLAAAPTDFPDRFAQSPNTGILYMAFPQYLDDTFTEAHRQALSMSIDRELIIEKIFAGSGVAAHSAIPTNLGGRSDVCPFWNYDPDAAKAIWDAAGPLDGFDVWFNAGSGHEDWVAAVVNMWGNALGLDPGKVAFQSAEWADYLDHADNGEFTGPFRLGWGMDYPSPLNFLEPLYASYMTAAEGGSNASEHNDPAFDEALAKGKEAVGASGNLADAIPFYEAAEDLLCNTARTMPIRFSLNQFVWNEGVSNVALNAFGNLAISSVVDSNDGIVSMELTEPASLFPMDTNESEGTQVLQEGLFTGLVGFDATTGEQYMAAAESITSDDGGKTWTITLKDGWTFHNGEPVTAASYVDAWSFGARSELGFQNNGFYKRFVGYDELNAG
jgi:ABC-type oligopeptide transport system substrate-binding subunit